MCFFFNDTATTEIYPLSLHDALPIYQLLGHTGGITGRIVVEPYLITLSKDSDVFPLFQHGGLEFIHMLEGEVVYRHADRKSTRLNSSHANISYAVFCLKKKTLPF